MDVVEGINVVNVENWQVVYSGQNLNTIVTNGLIPPLLHRFRVKAISELSL